MRWIAPILVACAGCDGSTDRARDASIDASIVQLTHGFTPLLCTSGQPGDPTCPYSYIDLGDELGHAKIRMIFEALSTELYVTHIVVTADTAPLHVENLRFVSVNEDGSIAAQLGGAFPSPLDLAVATGIDVPDMALMPFSPTLQLALQYGAMP